MHTVEERQRLLASYADVEALHDFTGSGDSDDFDADDGSGVDSDPFASSIINSLMGAGGSRIPAGASSANANDMVVDYNSKFASSEPAMFRDAVVCQTMGVLIGKNKPNALLIGPAGCGKTKIVEDIARRLATDDATVPAQLKGYKVFELPISNIVAGASLVGQLEERVKDIVDYMSDPANKTILFIDEIHVLVDPHDHVYGKVAQILKPALARGDLRVIGATTLQEASDLSSDPAFSRRFTRVIVDELTREQTVDVMKAARGSFFTHYGSRVIIDDKVIETVAIIADRMSSPGSHRPDNALTLLDRSCADAIMDRTLQEARLAKEDPAMLKTLQSVPQVSVTERRIRKTAMQLMTGHASRESLNEAKLAAALSAVKGQDAPINRIVSMLRRRDLGLFEDKRPLAVLMAGASGVGKTETCRIIAKELTGCDPIVLNMTEYTDASTVNRILGSPAGYVGSESHTELPFDILQSNPHQVILLDELEKADRSVQRLFMSVLEDGKLRKADGVELDFSHAVIFATTNAGGGRATTRALGFAPTSGNEDSAVAASLSNWFDPEFLNRFGAVVQFDSINKALYREIVATKYSSEAVLVNENLRQGQQLPDVLDDAELDDIVERTYVPEFGARPALRAVRALIEDKVIEMRSNSACNTTLSTNADDADDAVDGASA